MNKNILKERMTVPINHKKMYKKGKRWVVGTATLFALTGLGTAVHADTVNNNVNNTSTPKATITSQASNFHRGLLMNASNGINSNSPKASQNNPQSSSNSNNSNQDNKKTNLTLTSPSTINSSTTRSNQSLGRENDETNNQPADFKNANNKYWNNMNGTGAYSKDSNGNYSEKTQIVLEYTQSKDKSDNENPLSIQPMNADELQDFNNHNIGVMPLYTSVNPSTLSLYAIMSSDTFQLQTPVSSQVPYITSSDKIINNGVLPSRFNLLHNLAYGDNLGNNQNAPIASNNYASVKNDIWNGFYTPQLFGYILTAPRNTDLRSLFAKYLYPQTLDGYKLDNNAGDGTLFSVKGNGVVTLPNQLTFPNTQNIAKEQDIINGDSLSNNTSVDSGAMGTILLTYAKQNDTITYTYNGNKVGEWTSATTGSSDNQNSELSKLYANIQQSDGNTLTSDTNYGLPKGYYIDSNTFNDFLNKLYNADETNRTHTTPGLNYGRHYVVPVQSTLPPTSTINVHYVDIDTKANKVISSATPVTSYSGTVFNIKPYQNNLPNGYQYVGVRNNIDKFNNHNHTVDILVKKTIPDTSILVQIVTHKHGKLLNSFTTTKQSGTPFNINGYKSYIPNGYHFVKAVQVPKTYNSNIPLQVAKIIVAKKSPKPAPVTPDGSILVQIITKKDNHLINSVTTTKAVNTGFNINDYQKLIPNDYHLVTIENNVNKYNSTPSIINLIIDKNTKPTPPRPKADGSILVQIINQRNGEIFNSCPTTKTVDTPFNINDYQSFIPSGYHLVAVQNNVTKYAQTPSTVNLIINKNTQPVKPLPKPKENGSILVQIVNEKDGEILNGYTTTKDIDTPFNVNDYKQYIPNGYQLVKITNNVQKYQISPQVTDLVITKSNVTPSSASSSASGKASSASAKPSSASSQTPKPSSSSQPKSSSVKPVQPSSSATPSSSAKPVQPSSSNAKSQSAPSSSSTPVQPSSASAKSASAPSSSQATPIIVPTSVTPTKSNSASSEANHSMVIKPKKNGHGKPKLIKHHSSVKPKRINHKKVINYKIKPSKKIHHFNGKKMNRQINILKHHVKTLRKEYNLPKPKPIKEQKHIKKNPKVTKHGKKLPQTSEANHQLLEIMIGSILVSLGLGLMAEDKKQE